MRLILISVRIDFKIYTDVAHTNFKQNITHKSYKFQTSLTKSNIEVELIILNHIFHYTILEQVG